MVQVCQAAMTLRAGEDTAYTAPLAPLDTIACVNFTGKHDSICSFVPL